MQDRGYIKWAPFNSLFNDNKLLNEIKTKKEKINKPTLSSDQIEFLNEKIFEAYTNHLKVYIDIYKDQKINKLTGYINNINLNKKCITFNNSYIFFNQILKITDFFEKSD